MTLILFVMALINLCKFKLILLRDFLVQLTGGIYIINLNWKV